MFAKMSVNGDTADAFMDLVHLQYLQVSIEALNLQPEDPLLVGMVHLNKIYRIVKQNKVFLGR